jgi:hypothetical protein
MTKPSKSFRAILAVAAVVGASTAALAASGAFDADQPVAAPASSYKFDTITPFLKFADAYGDRTQGGHGSFGIMPGHMASPSHVHSAAYHGIVIKGIVTDAFNGDKNPPRLPAGSYWYVPANVVHITACVSKEPCLFYTHSDAKFDFAPAEPRN